MDPARKDRSFPDQAALLTAVELRLADDIRVSRIRPDRVVVKYQPAARHLVCTPAQWEVLEEFRQPRTASSVLLQIIPEGRCPPLRDFYELIVKACHNGILSAEKLSPPPALEPARWSLRLRGMFARWLAFAIVGFGALALSLRAGELPRTIEPLIVGWLLVALARSAGYAVAASVVAGTGGDVYRPRFWWLSPVPHFNADLRDALMGGRDAEIDAALWRLAPLFAFAAIAALWIPQLLFPMLCAIYFDISPLWPSPGGDILRALYCDPKLATASSFMFLQNRLFTVLLKARLQFAHRKYLLVFSGYALAWLVLVFTTGCLLAHANALDLLQHFYAGRSLRASAPLLLGACAVLIFGTAGVGSWIIARHLRYWLVRRIGALRRPRAASVDTATAGGLLSSTNLFHGLPPEDIQVLAAAFKPERYPSGACVAREGEFGDRLYVVINGRLSISRQLDEIGGAEPLDEIATGDVFGERALLGDGRRTATVRCRTRCLLLSIDKTGFEQLILPRLSREAIEERVQRMSFLQHIELSRDWNHATIEAFSRHSRLHDFEAGDEVIHQGTPCPSFFLIYEGFFSVTKDGRETARLKRGDFYGELSVLLDNVATVSIVARTRGRCLMISLQDFLMLVTSDLAVGLQFEQIGSERLGRPLFVDRAAR